MERKAAVAGAFYPASKGALINQIDEYLAKARRISTTDNLEILIVPHAGYSYSGLVAAWGFKQVSKKYKRIILIGVSHTAYFEGASVWNEGIWQTPLGGISVDKDYIKRVILPIKKIESNLDVHFEEHSLEVELPFLQKVLDKFKIVPLLLGQVNDEVLHQLVQALAKNFNDETLLIVSSDLSHYPQYDVANKVDNETTEAILSGNISRFEEVIKKNLNREGVETCACGFQAIKIAMSLAKELGIGKIKLFKYANSGDISGDKSRVVGYAAIGFYQKGLKTKV